VSFHHDVTTANPRLTAPGFAAAAGWLARVNRCRMAAGADPAAALDTGTAVVAVLKLAELGRLPKDADDTLAGRFGIAPLPGTRSYFDPENGAPRPPPGGGKGGNFVPYFGSGGWVGIVREACPHPDAAFDLLADLAGPDRSAALLSDPALGFGPFRSEHLEQQREGVWQRYGLDPDRSKRLAEALRQYTALTLANPAFAPRGPDQAELMAALEKEVRRAATGQTPPKEAMQAAQAAWEKLDARHPAAAEWRRKSAGLSEEG
jgi:ABC-type glycerol-3-phosphate transport system substrate-binding protein